MNKPPVPTGIIILNKPAGPTSRDLVDQVARLIPVAKVGHAGTLDPLATGILIVCVGAATRLTDLLQHMGKSYTTTVRLGARSNTLDADGVITSEASPRVPSLPEVQEALVPLRGSVEQMPPEYSALKTKGRRAYDLARAGQTVHLAARIVQIDRIIVLEYAWPDLKLEIDCSKGTYIRSIARDVGEALGCGGYVQSLVRTRIGPFTIEQAIDPLSLSPDSIGRLLRPPVDAVGHLRRFVLDGAQIEDLAHGRTLPIPKIDPLSSPSQQTAPPEPEMVALVDSGGSLLALAELDSQRSRLQPRKVLM